LRKRPKSITKPHKPFGEGKHGGKPRRFMGRLAPKMDNSNLMPKSNWYNAFYPVTLLGCILLFWHLSIVTGMVDSFILPRPGAVAAALIKDFPLLASYGAYTIFEGLSGLLAGIILGYIGAVIMDRFLFMRKALYPLLVVSQTIPVIAVAPLLVLWLGYDMKPKIALVILTCFFPIAIGVYDGIAHIEQEYIDELRVLGGRYHEGLLHVKVPMSAPGFFSSVKIAATYAIAGAVVAEWIGGTKGLGVYMTRVRKSYEFDKLFAVILLTALVSLALIALVKQIERRVLRYVQM